MIYQHYSDNMMLNKPNNSNSTVSSASGNVKDWEAMDPYLEAVQKNLKAGWTVHLGKEGRLYYCNQVTESSGWLPAYEDWMKYEDLPYGWERAVDSKGRPYYINHLNKTSTYETPESVKWENPPAPRIVHLKRNASLGFGFVAGSERPVIVRFVTEGGPSINKLQPGDQILTVNGEDVREAPRDHVIQLVRSCESEVSLLVCQPSYNLEPGRKSTLLSAGKRAKLRTKPSRVRFAESVCVNGSPLFPASAFSLGDICLPPMANVLKVFLENGQTKSFKYDATTTVHDVVTSLLDKLCFSAYEMFSLVLEHVKSLKRNKLTLLDPDETIARIAARPGAHKLRCLFRVTFVPVSAATLKDLNALDYLYMQCCNDVTQERFAPELQPEVALRLAALQMYQHAIANNISPTKLSVKVIEREFGLERFVPASLFEAMKRKELRKLISHFLKQNSEITGSTTKVLTPLQAKLYYLDIIAGLPSYGAKCFSTNQREGVERVLLVSPRFGLSQIPNVRNSVPQQISMIEDFQRVLINREDDVTCSVTIHINRGRIVKFLMEERDACEFGLVLAGYYLLLTGKKLEVLQDRFQSIDDDNAPSYLSQHTVLPAAWSYLLSHQNRTHSVHFLVQPPFHPVATAGLEYVTNAGETNEGHSRFPCDRNMNSANVMNSNHANSTKNILQNNESLDLDIHSVMATELLEQATDFESDNAESGTTAQKNTFIEAKNEEVMRRLYEMQRMVENSEQYLHEQNELTGLYEIQRGVQEFDAWRVESLTKESGIPSRDDSDCESVNSSKISSADSTPQPGSLRHTSSLTTLAERIHHDLSGINASLNSFDETQLVANNMNTISSPRPKKKLNGLSLLLNNLQLTGNDISLSESDSESVQSPSELNEELETHRRNLTNRSSFGLHSPDGNTFGNETNYNLKEYLHQLKEISNTGKANEDDAGLAAKTLSKIYGFEIREDTFIEIDSDLIDLRSIPPPKTPDELDALCCLNAAPHGFDDSANKSYLEPDLETFLETVTVAPPAQRVTPSKELTPEEITSFIIPPPPNVDDSEMLHETTYNTSESLYSNARANEPNYSSMIVGDVKTAIAPIEYATVDRKGKFSCCPTLKKSENINSKENSDITGKQLEIPPRLGTVKNVPPVRPPKSTELLQRCTKPYLPKEASKFAFVNLHQQQGETPPELPPRMAARKNTDTCLPPQNQNNSSYIISNKPETLMIPATMGALVNQANNISNPERTTPYPKKLNTQTTKCDGPIDPGPPKSLIYRNGHIINGEELLVKTDIAMAGLLIKLDQVSNLCTAAHSAGGGKNINEEKFQQVRKELTEHALMLVTATKLLVVAMSDATLSTLPEHLTACLTSIRRITELTQDMIKHTSAPLQTRNIVLKVHDVAANFKELVNVQVGPQGGGKLALQAECLANVLATLLRSLRIFSP